MKKNLILNTDSYKNRHWEMLHTDIRYLQSIITARNAKKAQLDTRYITLFGIAAMLRDLAQGISREDIEEAEYFSHLHRSPINTANWEYLLNTYGGKLPVVIHAPQEGSLIPLNMPMVRIENTDPKCAWLVSFLETMMLRHIWYGSTIATNCMSLKKVFHRTLSRHIGDHALPMADYMLHNFGARGGSSYESEELSSMAHALYFKGSDSMLANRALFDLYGKDESIALSSVTASEHSVSCSLSDFEKRNDFAIAVRMLDILEKELNRRDETGGSQPVIVSAVIDTYDPYRFAGEFIGERLKDRVAALGNRGGKLVLRPDSGDPLQQPILIAKVLMDKFGYHTNMKGYKVLPEFLGILQGDGVNPKSIAQIIDNLDNEKIAISNLVFGMGGKLVMPENGRDTYSFAQKATAQKLGGEEWQPLLKAPITDTGKLGLSGHLSTFYNRHSHLYQALDIEEMAIRQDDSWQDVMVKQFENGEITHREDFATIRHRANRF